MIRSPDGHGLAALLRENSRRRHSHVVFSDDEGKNTTAWDCCYPGLEVLPDGTFVTTTYGSWSAGAPPYMASVRLTLAEIDRLAAAQRDPPR